MSGLLLDTQILVWVGSSDPRLPQRVRQTLIDPASRLFVSAVTAWEFADLEIRRRLPDGISLESILDLLDASVIDFPAAAWEMALTLPRLHRDPLDRMTIAHALSADLTLVTGDAVMREYPVSCLW